MQYFTLAFCLPESARCHNKNSFITLTGGTTPPITRHKSAPAPNVSKKIYTIPDTQISKQEHSANIVPTIT